MLRQLTVNMGNLLLSLSEIIDIANPFIARHQQRTAFIAIEIAANAGADHQLLENIFAASLLHDIGAITIEEKTILHNNEEKNLSIHCERGALLMEEFPLFRMLAPIIRKHHTSWKEWEEAIDDPVVFASQVIHLADFIERLIQRDKYILHQNHDIVETVRRVKGEMINDRIVASFLDLAVKEEFWLNLLSPRLYPVLLHNGPFKNIRITIKEIGQLADLFKSIIDFKSPFTATHTTGVSACAEKLSGMFGLSQIETEHLKIAGAFHDVGKLTIPDYILNKPAPLSQSETGIIRSHSYYTFHAINSIGGLSHIAEWAAFHHEKLDGSGYPFHCSSDEISTGSRIIAISDIFTAIIEDRPYRPGMDRDGIFSVFSELVRDKMVDKRITELLLDNYETVHSHVTEKQAAAKTFYEEKFINNLCPAV